MSVWGMKTITALLLILSASIAYCGLTGFLTKETRDWKFIQSVGGMKITQKENVLHVDCDVSGLTEVTVKPTIINSGLGVRKLEHKKAGKTIQLSLITSVIEKGIKPTCKPLDLSSYAPGEYSVVYLDPDGKTHALGKVVLKK